MWMVGNSTGDAPSACRRSLRALACSGVRVTRMRLPCKGKPVVVACSDMLFLLLRCCCAVKRLDNFAGSPRKGLLGQQRAQPFGLFNGRFRRPIHALLHSHLLLPILAEIGRA